MTAATVDVGSPLTVGAVVLAGMVGTATVAVIVEHTAYDVWGALWVAPLLLVVCASVARRMAAAEGEPGLSRFFLLAAIAKIVGGGYARYVVAFVLFGGSADAARYDAAGKLLAPALRVGNYQGLGKISGTRFLEVLTGQVYALVGPSVLAGYLVFSCLGFLGSCCFYQAFRLAVPGGDLRRYRLLIFFFPTILFWAAGIGKDSVMTLAIGMVAYGMTNLLRRRLSGAAYLVAGLWLSAVLRPHVTLIVLVALVGALVVEARSRAVVVERQHRRGFGLLLAALVVVSLVFVVGRAASFLSVDSLNADTAQTALDEVSRRTADGGSSFKAVPARDPVTFVQATVTVLLRPFVFEANSALELMAGVEGLFLFALIVRSRRRLARLLRHVARTPYVTYASIFLVEFIVAFSSIGNFGLLARERVQSLPFLLILLCLPEPSRRGAEVESVEGSPSTVDVLAPT